MKRNNKKKGFTLVELLVVIAILAILASVTVVGYTGFTKKAKESVANQEAEQVETLISASLLEGEIKEGVNKITYSAGVLSLFDTNGATAVTDEGKARVVLAALIPNIEELCGEGCARLDITFSGNDVATITYNSTNGESAPVYPFNADR